MPGAELPTNRHGSEPFPLEVLTMIQSFPTKTRVSWATPGLMTILVMVLAAYGAALGQNGDTRGRNNPYSPSPGHKVKQEEPAPPAAPVGTAPGKVAFVMQGQSQPTGEETRPTVAQRTYKIAKNAELNTRPPTEIYKIGVGDVLFVNLKNSAGSSGYHTVRRDGTIDFPLAGENVVVADQTVESIEEILASAITLFPDPQVEVKVREFGSHKITVTGLVDNAGEKNLQREAMPLFVVRAGAGVHPGATKAIITRAPLLKIETYDLRDSKTDDILIYPGNSVEFSGNAGSHFAGAGIYFISGEISSPGQKELAPGLTLYQSVVSSGGSKGNPKKAVIRRKNENGIFAIIEHNLRAIKDGKAQDPALVSGDIIEIR